MTVSVAASSAVVPVAGAFETDKYRLPRYILDVFERAPETVRRMLQRVIVVADELDRFIVVEKELFGWISNLPLDQIPLKIQDIFDKGVETVDVFLKILAQNETISYRIEEFTLLVDLFTRAMVEKNFLQGAPLQEVPAFFQGGREYLETFLKTHPAPDRAVLLAREAITVKMQQQMPATLSYNSELGVLGYCELSLFQTFAGATFELARLFGWRLPEERGESLENCIVRKMKEYGIDTVHYSHFSRMVRQFFGEGELSLEKLHDIDSYFFLISKLRSRAGLFFFLLITQPHSYSVGSVRWQDVLQLLQLFCQLCDTQKIDDGVLAIAHELYEGTMTVFSAIERLSSRMHEALEVRLKQVDDAEEELFLGSDFTELEKLRIREVLQVCSFDVQNEEESSYRKKSFLELKSLKKVLSKGFFSFLLSPPSFQHFSSFKKVFHLFHQIKVAALIRLDVGELLHSWYEARITSSGLELSLERRKVLMSQTPDHEKDLSEILKDLHPLSSDEIVHIKSSYQEIYSFGQKLKGVGLTELAEGVEALRSKKERMTDSDRNLLIALGREAIRNEFGIYPYNTQIIALLGLIHYPAVLKGRIAQVNTGEGKSTIIALLAFYHAILGRSVDVVSSSRYLASRDEEKYRSFFANYGIITSNLCSDMVGAAHFQGKIVFSTNFDLEFAAMRDYFRRDLIRSVWQDGEKRARPFEVVIVDEVDNLFIDSALNSARIAIASQLREDLVYDPLYKYVVANEELLRQEQKAGTVQAHIQKNLHKIFLRPEGSPHPSRIKMLIDSALKALSLEENKDYVVTSPEGAACREIVIVDKASTGRLSEGCRYSKGLHEFLELKHHIPVRKESLLLSSLCHPVYFGQYQVIYGLTGTIGLEAEKQELFALYQVDSFQIAPHRGRHREDLQSMAYFESATYEKALFAEIEKMKQEKRPTLLLFKTIEDSEGFAALCKEKGVAAHLLNARQREDESFVVAKAGSVGCVTIATNIAGRGTDIVLEEESVKNGGLHVVFAFMPQNDRVEMQGRGRAGRQGQSGSSRIIVNVKSELSAGQYSEFETLSAEEAFVLVKLFRDTAIVRESHARFFRSDIEKVNYRFLQKFVANYVSWRKNLQIRMGHHVFDGVGEKAQRYFAEHFYSVLEEIFEELSEKIPEEQALRKEYESRIKALYDTVIDACFVE